MSGHSKWANTKHRKGAQDAKRGKMFTKLAKEIMIASRMGGGDPDANPRLRAGIAAARSINMPKDNIDRAIKKGTGDLDGVNYEEITYEGYGPGGVAVLVECMTDNRNRTVGEVRFIFNKAGGNMGETGCVSYMFDKKGELLIEKGATDFDNGLDGACQCNHIEIVNLLIEKGAFDLNRKLYYACLCGHIEIAKLLIEKIKNEVSNLEQNFEFYQEEHGVDSSNIESLERLLEQVRILNGKNDEHDL